MPHTDTAQENHKLSGLTDQILLVNDKVNKSKTNTKKVHLEIMMYNACPDYIDQI